MSYFIDGTPYSYYPMAASDPIPLNVGLLNRTRRHWYGTGACPNVAWFDLDAHHDFRKTKRPDDLSNKLAWLCISAEAALTRGIHICELCQRMEHGYYRLQIPKREDFLLSTSDMKRA